MSTVAFRLQLARTNKFFCAERGFPIQSTAIRALHSFDSESIVVFKNLVSWPQRARCASFSDMVR